MKVLHSKSQRIYCYFTVILMGLHYLKRLYPDSNHVKWSAGKMLGEANKKSIKAAYSSLLRRSGYRSRAGQKVMIAQIAKKLADDENRIIVAEAPTGTGKSMAYLVATLPIAESLKKKVVIATSTVALQEQIYRKDLPEFIAFSGLKSEYILAKGKSRFLCPVRLSSITGYCGKQGDMFGIPADETSSPEQIFQAMHDAFDDGSWDGDRDNFSVSIPDQDWAMLTMDRRGCLGRSCRFYAQCPSMVNRSKLYDADVIVANHDLLLSDLSLGGGVILPNLDECIVIIDEAHSFPARARNHFGSNISLVKLQSALSRTPDIIGELESFLSSKKLSGKRKNPFSDIQDEALYLSNTVTNILALLGQELPSELVEVTTNKHSKQTRFCRGEIPESFIDLAEIAALSLKSILGSFERIADMVKDAISDGSIDHKIAEIVSSKIGNITRTYSSALDVFKDYSNSNNNDYLVARWITSYRINSGINHVLEQCPTDVSGFLYAKLWKKAYGSVITSATLTSLGSFEHFRSKTGIPYEPKSLYIKIASPFDYSRAKLCIPKNSMADSSNYQNHTAFLIKTLPNELEKSGGTLVLFSSRKQMQDVREALSDEIKQIILCQGELPRNILLKDHSDRIDSGIPSVIFGLASFAEGIDLPGNLCRHVIIAKLPFDPPGSPTDATIAENIEERGGNVFRELILPKACLRLVQAVGRLIRREDDEGKISILDNRLLTKRYGKELLAQLPKELSILS